MHLEYPIQKKHLAPFMNQYVCVVLHDGTRYVGLLTGCGKGRLHLNGNRKTGLEQSEVESKSDKKRRANVHKGRIPAAKRGKGSGAGAKGFIPPYPFGPPIPPGQFLALELASIALLFVLLP